MSRALIIGIDGMDFDLVAKWERDLPTLRSLQKFQLKSVFPPDSVSAWITIFTGLNPAQHGILHSIDYLDTRAKDFSIDTSAFKGRTFWDIASEAGKKVCVVNPFLAHPVWQVNGIMVSGPVFAGGKTDTFPASVAKRYRIPPLGGRVDFPIKKRLDDFIKKTEDDTDDLAEFGLKLLKQNAWDVYFITFLTLDRIQHFFWRYCDDKDPTYPGENPYSDIIRQFYIVFDRIIGRFISAATPSTELLVVSDHGHGRRCIKSLNLNEFLRRKGYLASRVKRFKLLDARYLIEKAKMKYLNFVYNHEMEDFTIKISKYVPRRKELKKSTYITNFNNSLTWVEKDFSGMNPFGGVKLNREMLEREDLSYDDLRNKIIREIAQITDPQTGKKILKWICPREKIYEGDFISKYPDIIFELNEEYGLGFALYTPVISLNTTHKKISGGHRKYGVLLLSHDKSGIRNKKPTILDVVPTILDILKIEHDINFSGVSIFKK